MNLQMDIVPSGKFVTVPALVGVTPEECDAMINGQMNLIRFTQIQAKLQAAAHELGERPAQGWC